MSQVEISYGKREARRQKGVGAGRRVGLQPRCLVYILTKRGINKIKQAYFPPVDPKMCGNSNAPLPQAQGVFVHDSPDHDVTMGGSGFSVSSKMFLSTIPEQKNFSTSLVVENVRHYVFTLKLRKGSQQITLINRQIHYVMSVLYFKVQYSSDGGNND